MRAVVLMRAAAAPYPGEVALPVHEDGVAVPDPGVRPEPASEQLRQALAEEIVPDVAPEGGCYFPLDDAKPEAAENGCKGTTKAGAACKGRAGDDGYCAAHKQG